VGPEVIIPVCLGVAALNVALVFGLTNRLLDDYKTRTRAAERKLNAIEKSLAEVRPALDHVTDGLTGLANVADFQMSLLHQRLVTPEEDVSLEAYLKEYRDLATRHEVARQKLRAVSENTIMRVSGQQQVRYGRRGIGARRRT
jgi:hypothetical protein